MGQSHSATEPREVSIEQISHELALRFAEKCFSHLEITHFKDNFKTLADHQDGVEFWKEDTLCQFLSLPDSLHAGPVIYQMSTYLGCFPFPRLAPCILTREAMVKVVTIMTSRYRKVLKRGDHDKFKLLFRSLAVFDRRMSMLSPGVEKPRPSVIQEEKSESISDITAQRPRGFAVDEPVDEDEDDDDLALAALEALDAIEVFQHDQRRERNLGQAHIPVENMLKLITLLLLFAPITPQENPAGICQALDDAKVQQLQQSAKAMITAFYPEASSTNVIRYTSFVKTITTTMPHLFRSLNPLFEHFMFSRNIDLSRHAGASPQQEAVRQSPIQRMSGAHQPLLTDGLLAQLSSSFEIGSPPSLASSSFFHNGATFNEIYSTTAHGTSMSSFSRQVLSWRKATLFLVSGSTEDNENMIVGAYLPERWKETRETQFTDDAFKSAVMFQLQPRHAIFRANAYNKSTPLSHFSTKTGISLGCIIPPSSRIQAQYQTPVLGPVSLVIDEDMSTATFQHDPVAGIGAFLTDPRLEEYQHSEAGSSQPKKVEFDIDVVEVWGIDFNASGEDEITQQRKRLAWEDAEVARRKGVNFGGDKDGARALLEMAGIIGDEANRSGGSV